jgi:GNAT superfamily N-acetyltransferase
VGGQGEGGAERAGEAVVASDRQYFAMSAAVHPCAGGATYHLDGLGGVGAATVTWVDDPSLVEDPARWVEEVVARTASLGAAEVRVYGAGAAGPLADGLAAAGFTSRAETAFAGHPPEGAHPVELVPVVDERALALRRSVYADLDALPDGHAADIDGWCEAEERRAATGGLRLFVAVLDGEAVGVVGAIGAGPVLRMKNLAVARSHRRRGIGASIVGALGAHSIAAGRPVGMIALDGEPGYAMYVQMGLPIVAHLVEWSRPVRPA